MAIFDTLIWQKLIGADVKYPTVSNWGFSIAASTTVTGPYAASTSSAGPTSYETVFDISGRGELVFVACAKPATVNSVSCQYQLTIDGNVVDTDITGSATQIGADDQTFLCAGLAVDTAGGVGNSGALKFNKSCKLEVQYSGDPGGSETISTRYWYWLT